MSLERLDYILAVAEEQNLTRAAKKLFVSQPALSNYINKLEEDLGVKLFDRNLTPIQVTKAGLLYIEKMKEIQKETLILRSELQQMGSSQIILHLGIGNTRGNHWLPLMIPAFIQAHPEVMIQLHEQGEDHLEMGIQNGNVDLAFGVLNTGYPELLYEEIVEEPVLLAIPRNFSCMVHLKEYEATIEHPYLINKEQLGTIPFLLPYPGTGFYRCATLLMERAGIRPGKILNYSNMNTAYQLTASGVGALFVTMAFFDQRYPNLQKNIAFCTLQNPVYSRKSVAGFRPDNVKMDLIQEMISIVRKNIVPVLKEGET